MYKKLKPWRIRFYSGISTEKLSVKSPHLDRSTGYHHRKTCKTNLLMFHPKNSKTQAQAPIFQNTVPG